MDRPNEKLFELVLTAATARDLGVRHLTLVAPYLCYMRQDTAFVPGEAVSQRVLGTLLADWFDTLVTVDPHLHRVPSLADAIPVQRAVALSAAGPMAEFLATHLENPLVLGPDSESLQWVAAVAAVQGLDYGVARKERLGDREVRIALPELDVLGRSVVLLDDVVSTGGTLIATAQALKPLGPRLDLRAGDPWALLRWGSGAHGGGGHYAGLDQRQRATPHQPGEPGALAGRCPGCLRLVAAGSPGRVQLRTLLS